MTTRREWLLSALGGLALPGRAALAALESPHRFVQVETPNGSTLPWTWDGGVKVFRLVAEPVRREFAPGLVVNCWGYNGSSPGPTLEAVEGERVRILVTNHLDEDTSIHWHGVLLPSGMDGVSGLSQKPIAPGETFRYEFTLKQSGTQMYHPHSDEMTQMAMGMMGFFVIHPRVPVEPRVDRDFCLFLSEWAVRPGSSTPDPVVMTDFNLFTINSRVYPGTAPLRIRTGERVRIRLANLSMDSHPLHMHGFHFRVTGTDGGRVPLSAQWPSATVDVPPGTTRDIEFLADEPGDWAFHCHKTHHVMNQMGHQVPNLLGVSQEGLEKAIGGGSYMAMDRVSMGAMHMDNPENTIAMQGGKGPYGDIDMGGMFTILQVRDDPEKERGFYRSPSPETASKEG